MEKEATYWYSRSDRAILGMLGEFIHKTRLRQNKTQQSVAEAAGINRSTLIQMEAGKGGTLLSFIQVMRALEQLSQFQSFEIRPEFSPLQLAEMEMKQRQRASKKSANNDQAQSDW